MAEPKKKAQGNGSKSKPNKNTDVVGAAVAGGKEQKESTRSSIAVFFIKGFLFAVGGVLILGTIKGYTVAENKDMLLAVSGILSGPLGFIIGYYFKSQEE
jgi:hypothetical protein